MPMGGIDGWILSMTPISVKGSEGIGYPEIERFEKSLQKRGKSDGFFVAFSFSKPATKRRSAHPGKTK